MQPSIEHQKRFWGVSALRIAMLVALTVIALMIWGLGKLAIAPYYPPYDSRLSGAEIVFVLGMILMFSLIWFLLLVSLVLSFVRKDLKTHGQRIAMLVALTVIALMIWGLYKLATLPYRPPHDMSTFLGQEVVLVWGMIGLLSVVWILVLRRVAIMFFRKGN